MNCTTYRTDFLLYFFFLLRRHVLYLICLLPNTKRTTLRQYILLFQVSTVTKLFLCCNGCTSVYTLTTSSVTIRMPNDKLRIIFSVANGRLLIKPFLVIKFDEIFYHAVTILLELYFYPSGIFIVWPGIFFFFQKIKIPELFLTKKKKHESRKSPIPYFILLSMHE